MNVPDFSYELPEELIADRPAAGRGTSRWLVVHKDSGELQDAQYAGLARFLKSGNLLVLNDTRVIKARLLAHKANGAARELIILEKHGHENDWHRHKVMYHGKLAAGDRLQVGDAAITVEKVLGGGLLTNFHAPRSTVLMLTAAFAGWLRLRTAYEHAIAKRYHFLSYGDSMLII